MEKYKKIGIVAITIILFIGIFIGKSKCLEGVHILENIMGKGEYTFYVDARQTDFYTFSVNRFNKNAQYTVYNAKTGELITEGKFGYTSEGYYPFIEMALEKDNTYKTVIVLEDEHTFGLAHIKALN